MKFDRTAPGEGVEISCSTEKGKMFLDWKFHFVEDGTRSATPPVTRADRSGAQPTAESGSRSAAPTLHLRLIDMAGNVAVECMQRPGEDEPLRSVLLQPHLWNGVKEPYLYTLEAVLKDRGWADGKDICLDQISGKLPLRILEIRKTGSRGEEMFLNGDPFIFKAVNYSFPGLLSEASEAEQQRVMFEDLQQLLRLGANCIYLEKAEESTGLFSQLCERMGILVWDRPPGDLSPWFRSVQESLFLPGSSQPASLFYKYKAMWSREPFVYIVPESVKPLKSGNFQVRCYSNCARVALYSDGTLFEFQRGEGEFTFWEVPIKSPCIVLSAEGEGCSTALSLHKTFTKSSLNGDI